jgi:hypothetical protein
MGLDGNILMSGRFAIKNGERFLRCFCSQEVVLYQYDLADPMNPLGLLVAYAEAHVLPVSWPFFNDYPMCWSWGIHVYI